MRVFNAKIQKRSVGKSRKMDKKQQLVPLAARPVILMRQKGKRRPMGSCFKLKPLIA